MPSPVQSPPRQAPRPPQKQNPKQIRERDRQRERERRPRQLRARELRRAAHAAYRPYLDPGRAAVWSMALATVALVSWHLTRPALWLDEAASAVAVQRDWPDLWTLTRGADAPLVPFYAALKLGAAALPGAGPELQLRWLSAAAIVAAGTALVGWLVRHAQLRLALATGAAFLLTGGVSRYAQEARPYALVLLGAVLATVAWSRLARRRHPRWVAVYAVAVAGTVVMHSLAGALVAAHLVAAVIALPPGARRRAAARTLVGGGLGVAAAAPLAVLGIQHGQGATRYPALTVENLFRVFVQLFTGGDRPLLGLGAVLLLAVAGLARAALDAWREAAGRRVAVASSPFRLRTRGIGDDEGQFVIKVAIAWALVPPVLLLPALALRPNLLIGRYLLFVVPGWVVLAGLGLVTVAELAHRVATRLRNSSGPAAALAVTALVLVLATATQLPTLKLIRTTWGHGEDIRPALALADRPQYRQLAVVVPSTNGAVGIAAYGRPAEHRLIGPVIQRDQPAIWPVPDALSTRIQLLRLSPQVAVLLRGTNDPGCRFDGPTGGQVPAAQLTDCLPPLLTRMGYRVLDAEPSGRGWAFAVLDRTGTRPDRN